MQLFKRKNTRSREQPENDSVSVTTDRQSSKKRNRIIIVVVAIFIVATIGMFGAKAVITKNNLSPDSVKQFAETYFNACLNKQWDDVYNMVEFQSDKPYQAEAFFIEQLNANHESILSKGLFTDGVTNIQYAFETKDDQVTTLCRVTYDYQGESQHYEFTILANKQSQLRIDPTPWLVDYEIIVPSNTDVTLNNNMLDKNYISEELPNQYKYQVQLIKGKYPLSVKSLNGVPENLNIYVGIPNEQGVIANAYEADSFNLYENDLKDIQNRVKEFINAFYSGINDGSTFTFKQKYYAPALNESINAQRLAITTTPPTKYVSSNLAIKNAKINEIGQVELEAAFRLTNSSATNTKGTTTDEMWQVTLGKSDNEWVIQSSNFGKK